MKPVWIAAQEKRDAKVIENRYVSRKTTFFDW
jgi:hypothetical protein